MGQTTGLKYDARGVNGEAFAGFVPATGDGTFTFTIMLRVNREHQEHKDNFLFHETQTFTVSDNGNTLNLGPL